MSYKKRPQIYFWIRQNKCLFFITMTIYNCESISSVRDAHTVIRNLLSQSGK
jgi:hypothetical protein